MGAEQFHDKIKAESVEEAFNALVEEARYEYGHGGYTGTIAEKDGYVFFDRELAPSLALAVVDEALTYQGDPVRIDDFMSVECGARMIEVADSKWGPAAAIRDTDGFYHFFGWASS